MATESEFLNFLQIVGLDLRRFRGLFKAENSARKGEHCHEPDRPTGVSPRSDPDGRTSEEKYPIPGIAREIGVSDGTLRNWVNQDEIGSGEREGAHDGGEGGAAQTQA